MCQYHCCEIFHSCIDLNSLMVSDVGHVSCMLDIWISCLENFCSSLPPFFDEVDYFLVNFYQLKLSWILICYQMNNWKTFSPASGVSVYFYFCFICSAEASQLDGVLFFYFCFHLFANVPFS